MLGVVRTPDMAGAVRMVNAHEYGNGVAIFTSDGGAARDFAAGINIGMVGVNVPIPVPMAFHSFGGWKHSLFGDHHIYGPEGVRFYTRYKAVTQRWPTGARRGAEYVMPNDRDADVTPYRHPRRTRICSGFPLSRGNDEQWSRLIHQPRVLTSSRPGKQRKALEQRGSLADLCAFDVQQAQLGRDTSGC